jgi:hypothetical protein
MSMPGGSWMFFDRKQIYVGATLLAIFEVIAVVINVVRH